LPRCCWLHPAAAGAVWSRASIEAHLPQGYSDGPSVVGDVIVLYFTVQYSTVSTYRQGTCTQHVTAMDLVGSVIHSSTDRPELQHKTDVQSGEHGCCMHCLCELDYPAPDPALPAPSLMSYLVTRKARCFCMLHHLVKHTLPVDHGGWCHCSQRDMHATSELWRLCHGCQ
jgi:hypothetical protein